MYYSKRHIVDLTHLKILLASNALVPFLLPLPVAVPEVLFRECPWLRPRCYLHVLKFTFQVILTLGKKPEVPLPDTVRKVDEDTP